MDSCPYCSANLKGFQLEAGAKIGNYQIEHVLGQVRYYLRGASHGIEEITSIVKQIMSNNFSSHRQGSLSPP
jgi:hypothetical protein